VGAGRNLCACAATGETKKSNSVKRLTRLRHVVRHGWACPRPATEASSEPEDRSQSRLSPPERTPSDSTSSVADGELEPVPSIVSDERLFSVNPDALAARKLTEEARQAEEAKRRAEEARQQRQRVWGQEKKRAIALASKVAIPAIGLMLFLVVAGSFALILPQPPAAGTLRLDVTPADAALTLDGMPVGWANGQEVLTAPT
jgi:hypothetical protein